LPGKHQQFIQLISTATYLYSGGSTTLFHRHPFTPKFSNLWTNLDNQSNFMLKNCGPNLMVNAHSTATPDFSDFPTKRHPHITAGKPCLQGRSRLSHRFTAVITTTRAFLFFNSGGSDCFDDGC